MLYNDTVWESWCNKIERNFVLKAYNHLDHRFDFPKRKKEIHAIVSDPERMKFHSFLPLLKIITKTPRLRYNVKKKKMALENKERPISFASHFDTYLYSFYSFALSEQYQRYIREEGFDPCVLAYRSDLDGHCNIQFARTAFDHILAKGPCTAITLDIKGYFDSIDHQLLKKKWAKVLRVPELPVDQYALFRSLTKYSYIYRNSLLKHFNIDLPKDKYQPTLLDYIEGKGFNEKFELLRERHLIAVNTTHELQPDGWKRFYGIPQGLSISALLSNVYLIDYDQMMYEKAMREGFLYLRYCDDILLVCDSERAADLQAFAISEIKKYHLEIQDKKVERIQFLTNAKGQLRAYKSTGDFLYKNLQYLGFEFDGQQGLIRSGSVSRFYRKMKGGIGKTVSMGYSENAKGDRIFKRQILHRYTHLGKRNFLSYAYRASQKKYQNAAGIIKPSMGSPAIRRQMRRHVPVWQQTLQIKNELRAMYKSSKGKLNQYKSV